MLLLGGAWMWEGPDMAVAAAKAEGLSGSDVGLFTSLAGLFAYDPWPYFNAFFMSFLVNLSCFFAIQTTSSLTFKVGGLCW